MSNAPLLSATESTSAVAQIASSFGLDAEQAAPAVASLTESLASRLTRMTLSRGGIADIVALLGENSQQPTTDAASAADKQGTIDQGNHILDVLIGDKHVSRGFAQRAASQSGVDVELTKKLLPVVAETMISNLQQQTKPQFTQIASKLSALGGNNKGSPLPLPGDSIPGVGRKAPSNNPFENLPDIIRRGGTEAPGGGSLEAVIRQIIGSLLGNKNRGVLGTLIQGLILRWIANFVRRMLTRAPA